MMSKKLNANDAAFQRKMKTILKLRDNAVRNEKDLQNMSAEAMLLLPGITVREMATIIELQKKVKTNRLFSYLIETADFMEADMLPVIVLDDEDPVEGAPAYEV